MYAYINTVDVTVDDDITVKMLDAYKFFDKVIQYLKKD